MTGPSRPGAVGNVQTCTRTDPLPPRATRTKKKMCSRCRKKIAFSKSHITQNIPFFDGEIGGPWMPHLQGYSCSWETKAWASGWGGTGRVKPTNQRLRQIHQGRGHIPIKWRGVHNHKPGCHCYSKWPRMSKAVSRRRIMVRTVRVAMETLFQALGIGGVPILSIDAETCNTVRRNAMHCTSQMRCCPVRATE